MKKITVLIMIAVFSFHNLTYGLAPYPRFFKPQLGQHADQFSVSPLTNPEFLTVAISIAEHFLLDNNEKKTLGKMIRDKFRNAKTFLEGTDLNEVRYEGGVVYIPYKTPTQKYEVKICLRNNLGSIIGVEDISANTEQFGIIVKPVNDDTSGDMVAYTKRIVWKEANDKLIKKLNTNGDINYWDREIRKAAEKDDNKKQIKVLLERGANRSKVISFDIPGVLFDKTNMETGIKYLVVSIYDEIVCEGASNVIIFMEDKSEEAAVARAVKEEMKHGYERVNIYGNFGDDIQVCNSSDFSLTSRKEIYTGIHINPKNSQNKYLIGVDVGGTNVKTVITLGDKVVKHFSQKVDLGGGVQLKDQILDCVKKAQGLINEKIEAVGITFPSPIKKSPDGSFEVIRLTNFERYWAKTSVGRQKFSADYSALEGVADDVKKLGLDNVAVLNDADAFGYGEIFSRLLNGENSGEMGTKVVLPIGTGPGYVKIKNGVIENVPNQGGHMVIDLSETAPVCPGCGVKGCYGGHVPASAMESLVTTQGLRLNGSLELVEDIAKWIAVEAVRVHKITGADEIILAGGISQGKTGENLVRLANKEIHDKHRWYYEKVQVYKSSFDVNYGGAIGAAQYALACANAERREQGSKWNREYSVPVTNIGKDNIGVFFDELTSQEETAYVLVTNGLADFMINKQYCWFEKARKNDIVLYLDAYDTPEDLCADIKKRKINKLIAIGAGTLTDWAKYVGNVLKKDVISIPSALSGNGMFTEKAVFYEGVGGDRSRLSKTSGPVAKVIIDVRFLQDLLGLETAGGISGKRTGMAGVGDLVSIYSALFDWEFAAREGKEPIDEDIFKKAKGILTAVTVNADMIKKRTDAGMIILTELLEEASLLNMRYGTSRPKDGSEHLLADEIDRRLPDSVSRLHCEIVAIASLMVGYLYCSEYDHTAFVDIRKMIRDVGLPTRPEEIGLTKGMIIDALMNVNTRTDKYTFFDVLKDKIDRRDAELAYEIVFGDKQGEIDEFTFEVSRNVNNSVKAMYAHISKNVTPRLDKVKTKKLVNLLQKTKEKGGKVIINAAGRVGEVAVFFQQKLRALGYHVDDLKEITPEFLINKDDLVLTISGSGKTSSVVNNLNNIVESHTFGDLDREIFSITATPDADIWNRGKEYHNVMHIKGRTKEVECVARKGDGAEYLPLSSTFEYSIMLYLEGIIETLTRDKTDPSENEIIDIVKGVVEKTPEGIKAEIKENLKKNEIVTKEFVKRLLSSIKINKQSGTITQKHRIYLFGLGQNNYVIRLFARRMQNIGFEVYVPGPRDIVSGPREGDVTIFVSNSGSRGKIMEKVSVAKEMGCPIIAITANPWSDLANRADLVIPVSSNSTSAHTAHIMGDDEASIEQRHLKRTFEIASVLYLEGISVAIMKKLGIDEMDLKHVPKQWELKGREASHSNPIIEKMIAAGKMVEVVMVDGELEAYFVKHVKGYLAGKVTRHKDRGASVAITDLLDKEQIYEFKEWMVLHSVNELPVKFRIAMDEAALSWKNDIQHSNIAHAGFNDHAIYMGELLFRHVFESDNKILRTEILDNDEYKHILGEGHGTDADVKKRLELVAPVIKELNMVRQMILQMKEIHSLDMDLLPPVEKGKTLWHVIPVDLMPVSIRADFAGMVSEMNSTYPNSREKIRVVTDRQDIAEVIAELSADANNIIDVALADKKDLEKLPQGVKALIFEGELGDFRQLEGILAALRALQSGRQEALISLYKTLTGSVFDGDPYKILENINDPQALSDIITFHLKPMKINTSGELERLNKRLLEFIQSA